MRKIILFTLSILLFTVSCTQKGRDKTNTETQIIDTSKGDTSVLKLPPPAYNDVTWNDSGRVKLAIDTTIDFADFRCDSAIIIGYKGTFGEALYMPLNDSGQWISTIWKKRTLTRQQITFFQTILSNSSAYKDMDTNWYQPTIALVFFKNGKVVAQSVFCYGGDKIATLNLPGYDGSNVIYNKKMSNKLKVMFDSLGFNLR